jgi:hypothetical protein
LLLTRIARTHAICSLASYNLSITAFIFENMLEISRKHLQQEYDVTNVVLIESVHEEK